MSPAGEFEFIARSLAPLSQGAPGAAGLSDDGAVLDLGPGEVLAVTSDTVIEGRHFPMDGDPQLAAAKALRTNLSDLAAMGARPFAYMLNIVWPKAWACDRAADRAEAFVAGLKQEQDAFAIRLIGGDTTSADSAWTLAVTMFGRRPAGLALRRDGARAGDALVVTGAIGDAVLGLASLQGESLGLDPDSVSALQQRSLRPAPRLNACAALRRHGRAVLDVSDGLLADARHLATQSGLSLHIDLERIPHSHAALRWLTSQQDEARARLRLAAGGDDYELLIATDRADALILELADAGLPAAVIGAFHSGPGEVRVGFEGRALTPESWGFTHF